MPFERDKPVVIETVGSEEKIDSLAKVAGEIIEKAGVGAMITEERVHVIRYTAGGAK